MTARRVAIVLLFAASAASCRALLEADELGLGDSGQGGGGDGDGDGDTTSSSPNASSGGGTQPSSSNASSSTGGGGAPSSNSASSGGASTSVSDGSSSTGSNPECGNDEPNEGEDCDDGGTAPNDGCSPICKWEGLTCDAPIVLAPPMGGSVVVTTTNADGTNQDACEDGPARFFRVDPVDDGFVSIWARDQATTFYTVITQMPGCPADGGNYYCTANSFGPHGGEVFSNRVEAGEPMFFAISGEAPGDVGTFEIEVSLHAGTCADPIDLTLENASAFHIRGNTGGMPSTLTGSCGGAGPEVVYRVSDGGMASTIDSVVNGYDGFDPLLYARTTCGGGGELGCGENDEHVPFTMSSPTFVIVDSVEGGDYSVTLYDSNSN